MTTTSQDTLTKLRPPWLHITRVVWIVLTLATLLMLVVSTVIAVQEPLPSCVGGDVTCGPWAMTREDAALAQQLGLPAFLVPLAYYGSSLFAKAIFFLIGLLIFARRSDDGVAQMLSLMLTMFVVEGIQNLGPWMPLVTALYTIPTALFVLLPLLVKLGLDRLADEAGLPGTKTIPAPHALLSALALKLTSTSVAPSTTASTMEAKFPFPWWL